MKPRQRLILQTLKNIGGEASIREIAQKAGLNTNGVSQSLGAPALSSHVKPLGKGRGGDAVWKTTTLP